MHNSKDEIVLHAMSRVVGPPLSLPRRQRVVVSYTIKSPKLMPGEYYVSFYVANYQRTLLWVENVPAFTVTAASYFGVLEVISGIKGSIVPEFEMSLRQLAGVPSVISNRLRSAVRMAQWAVAARDREIGRSFARARVARSAVRFRLGWPVRAAGVRTPAVQQTSSLCR